MAKKETTKNNSLEERGVKALESIADSIGDINDWLYELDFDMPRTIGMVFERILSDCKSQNSRNNK